MMNTVKAERNRTKDKHLLSGYFFLLNTCVTASLPHIFCETRSKKRRRPENVCHSFLTEILVYFNNHTPRRHSQGSKLTLANLQNARDFDNLRVRKISTSKRLRVRIIHVSQTVGESSSNARRHVRTTSEANKAGHAELRRAPFFF